MDERKINEAFSSLAGDSVKAEKIKKAALSGNMDAVLNNLTPEQAATLKNLLSNKAATKELLSSPEAIILMKALFGNK